MYKTKEYIMVNSLEEALNHLQSDGKNTIIGGMMWMRLSNFSYDKVIDLSNLNLTSITENENEIIVEPMVTLKSFEENKSIQQYYGSFFSDSFSHIVGTQFKNSATIGGSVCAKLNFSDINSTLLAIEAEVEIYQHGRMKLEEYLTNFRERNFILEKIYLPKKSFELSYQTIRNVYTDLPTILLCLAKTDEYKIVVASRPGGPIILKESSKLLQELNKNNINWDDLNKVLIEEAKLGSNNKATKEYRMQVLPYLLQKAYNKIEEQTTC